MRSVPKAVVTFKNAASAPDSRATQERTTRKSGVIRDLEFSFGFANSLYIYLIYLFIPYDSVRLRSDIASFRFSRFLPGLTFFSRISWCTTWVPRRFLAERGEIISHFVRLLQMSHRSSQSVRYTRVGWVCVAFGFWLQLISGNLIDKSSSLLNRHSVTKRSFYDLQCKGVYDKSIFARLDQICEDCYNLFREPSIYSLCRDDCFSTKYFGGCCETLLCEDVGEIQDMIKQLNGGKLV